MPTGPAARRSPFSAVREDPTWPTIRSSAVVARYKGRQSRWPRPKPSFSAPESQRRADCAGDFDPACGSRRRTRRATRSDVSPHRRIGHSSRFPVLPGVSRIAPEILSPADGLIVVRGELPPGPALIHLRAPSVISVMRERAQLWSSPWSARAREVRLRGGQAESRMTSSVGRMTVAGPSPSICASN
jgi:hypothetical protein